MNKLFTLLSESSVLLLLILLGVMGDTYKPIVPSANEKFYIYSSEDWDKVATMSHRKRDPREILNMSYNNGAGDVLDASAGMYHTDQYHMYDLVYFRLLTDPRRTRNPDEATSFFVPYDFSLDSAFYKHCVKSVGVCFDFRKCPRAPTVERLLTESKYWTRNQGRDHFTIIGMNYAMEHYLNKPKCKSFLVNTCQNCTKFSIDDYSFLFAERDGIPLKGDDWHAAPFPSDFHWNVDFKGPYPWEHQQRDILVSYTGTSASFWAPARRLRQSIVHYCSVHRDCVHVGYGANGTRSSMQVAGYSPLEVAKRSVFCLQPYGDLMTRKGLFDGIMMGCIPVTFSQLTASSMYVWHWEEDVWKAATVSLPSKGVAHRYEDPVQALVKLYKSDPEGVKAKQALIRRKAFELHWAIHPPPSSSQRSSSSSWPLTEDGTPLPDAFELLLRWTLGWHSGRLPRGTFPAHIPSPSAPGANPCWSGMPNHNLTRCIPKPPQQQQHPH